MRPVLRDCAPGLALVLACTPPGAARGPEEDPKQDRKDEVRVAHAPISAADLTRLTAALTARAPLYWRVRTVDGPRCEPWQPVPDPADPHRGRLVHTAGADRFAYAYHITDDQLQLTDPTRERDTLVEHAPPSPGTRVASGLVTDALAYPCVFSGMFLVPADTAAARRLVLTSRERWFLDADACAAAGPDIDPQPAAPGELHPLGCASALADPLTRARRPTHAAASNPAAARLRTARRLYMLRERAGQTTCELWRPTAAPGSDDGQLAHSDRDEHGSFEILYDYAVLGDTLTLLGPSEFRRLHQPAGPTSFTRTGGCLHGRPLTLRQGALLVGDDPWFLTRRACEAARRSGAPARPAPDCRPGHVPKASP